MSEFVVRCDVAMLYLLLCVSCVSCASCLCASSCVKLFARTCSLARLLCLCCSVLRYQYALVVRTTKYDMIPYVRITP